LKKLLLERELGEKRGRGRERERENTAIALVDVFCLVYAVKLLPEKNAILRKILMVR
jgi:hypothetical protein